MNNDIDDIVYGAKHAYFMACTN